LMQHHQHLHPQQWVPPAPAIRGGAAAAAAGARTQAPPTPLALAQQALVADCSVCQQLRTAGLAATPLLREERHGPEVFRQDDAPSPKITWRLKERMKTANCALIMCLNIGTDPPDVVKTSPCARKECWIDPTSTSRSKARESIGKALQEQYEKLQPRARYKLSLDPTPEDFRKLCISLRRSAKGDRVLFHYNGHGVPRPTANGEVSFSLLRVTVSLTIYNSHCTACKCAVRI
jgi:Raptor N-terminal CASPase like domain